MPIMQAVINKISRIKPKGTELKISRMKSTADQTVNGLALAPAFFSKGFSMGFSTDSAAGWVPADDDCAVAIML